MENNKVFLEENTGTDGSVLEKEWAYYMSNRDEIVRKYRDKYVVISDDRVVAAYDDENDAYFDTIKSIPLGSFMIHHVTEPEEVIQISPIISVYTA
jgi:hypothetical protein